MDINVQLQEFKAMRQKLTELTADAASAIASLDVNNYSRSLEKLHEKLTSDTFKIMVMGSFKNGKSTFINSLLGEEVLPAYVTPCTAIINEVKYNSETKAILYFMDPLPETYTEVPEKALAHMHKHGMKNIPPLEISIDEIEDYLTIPLGMGAEEAGKQSAYEKMELFWPLELLKNNVEIIDSPGLNENPVRTRITMGYLANADAIIFVFNSLAFGSYEEMEYIDTTLAQSGFNKKSIFGVVNRYDMLPKDSDKLRVKNLAEQMLENRTEHIFYTSAANALTGKINGDRELLKSSAMPEVEAQLAEYLTKERGRIKLATPAQELLRIIRDDILNGVIPRRRSVLSMDLDSFKKRFEAEKPNIEKLRQQRELILSKAEAYIANMQPDVRRCVINYINDLPARIKAWTEEYTPQTKFSLIHPKQSMEAIIEEVTDHLSRKLDVEIRSWTAETLTALIADKIEELKCSMEGRVGDFYVQLDDINFNITNNEKVKAVNDSVPVWQRVVAAGGGWFIAGPQGAFAGAVNGLSKDFAKEMAIQIGVFFVAGFLGLMNPVVIVGIVLASMFKQGIQLSNQSVNTAKKNVCESICNSINEQSQKLSEEMIGQSMAKIRECKDFVGKSLNTEIEQVNGELNKMVEEKEKGEDNIKMLLGELDENEAKLRDIEKRLTGFVFELLK